MGTSTADRTELERRLLWLVRAVWRQMSDSNCIEASLTLHGAMTELGIKSEVQAVAAWTVDVRHDTNVFLGRAAYEYFRERAAAAGHTMPDYVPIPGAPDFFVDGGHVVVLLPELEFLLDATLDQIPGFPLETVVGPAGGLTKDEPATFGSDDAWVGYLLVDDVVVMDPDHRKLIMDSGVDLARKGVEVGFEKSALDTNTPLFKRVVD